MKRSTLKPHIVLPPLFWLVLAVVCFIAAFGVWQNQRLERMRPPASAAPASAAGPLKASAVAEPGPAAAQRLEAVAPGAAAAEAASAPMREPNPQAGRQVLRCVVKGRVTYRDLNAGCPEGASERVTVFPTEGVGKPQ